MKVDFDDSKHLYSVGGRAIKLSVTGILPKPEFFCTPEELEKARQEGKDNHSMIKMYHDTGGETCDSPFLVAYDTFIRENEPVLGKFMYCERPLYSEKDDYAGTPDLIFTKALIDLKRTIGDKRYHALQLAGYHALAHENQILPPKFNRWLVLTYDGNDFRLVNVYNDKASDVFKMLLRKRKIEINVSNYFNTTF